MKKAISALICAVVVLGTLATVSAEQGDWRGGIRSRIQESRQKIERVLNGGLLTGMRRAGSTMSWAGFWTKSTG
jgi:hypothetical protein